MEGNFQHDLPVNLGIPNSTAGTHNLNKRRRKLNDNEDSSEQPSNKKPKVKSSIQEKESKGNQVFKSDQLDSLKMKPGKVRHTPALQKKQLGHAQKWTTSNFTICANWHVIGRCSNLRKCPESRKKLLTEPVKDTKKRLKKHRDDGN